jgi:hypothetical protein
MPLLKPLILKMSSPQGFTLHVQILFPLEANKSQYKWGLSLNFLPNI